ncbi:molybdenum cofactor cytidylyltransferase/nicotine blue oxidoreductase [Kribbella sp. VKM Ac-2527]|uniref:Molybdenum cofactor cytidylyltransferase/nicotine blue oxidoreductase n=1 Tax=Kribbella caucasensis TaxID=2512215 RepID=A0A4R6K3Z6_9ACTN|nr:nucleotidyltransferase family protein [Kribbella sp. VKM Ac-2527]TDO43122.1 molybdenum cofactor cytidylyltransferase/nicotine blue oxidoreductase [Kribbella sp. VKM Ac-2527]
MEPVGVLLAAGAGTRMGMPKALVRDEDGVPWVVRTVRVMREGGCGRVAVVVGASADEVVGLLDGEDVTVVPATDWSDGMSASLRAGLAWVAGTDAETALVHLVDMPDVGSDVVRRVVAAAGPGESALARAGYYGRAGHPVMMGRAHWTNAAAAAVGDRGAGSYLKRAGCPLIPCDDLAAGHDQDS